MVRFYSQTGQDKFLKDNVFKDYKNGFFVNVCANDGIIFDNTFFFEKNYNWKGINIEPNPSVFEKLKINRPNCINLNYAIDISEGEKEFIMNDGYSEMLSGLKEYYDERHLKRLKNETEKYGNITSILNVKTNSLENIFEKYNITKINYISIDVEGAEFSIIKSINFEKVYIDVIDFENNYEDKSKEIVDYLLQKDYVILKKYSDIIMIHKNSIFVQ